jgi:DNA-binding CsgD family transcriptional regulator
MGWPRGEIRPFPWRVSKPMKIKDLAYQQVFTEVKRLCHRGLHPSTLLREVVERLKGVVPFEFYNAMTVDPLSGLATDFVTSEAQASQEEARFFFEHTYFKDHMNRFGWMAKNRISVALLSESANGKPERALRHRRPTSPAGFGHELRSVFTTGRELWGGMCITRKQGRAAFDAREVMLLRRVAPQLGASLRRTVLREQAQQEPNDGACASGVLILDHQGRVVRRTAAAVRWLRELDGAGSTSLKAGSKKRDGLPAAVWSVVGALRRALNSETERDLSCIPRLLVRTPSGRWLTLQASLAETHSSRRDETVVVVGPAEPEEVVRLYTTAYALSPREEEVVNLVVRGYSTKQISTALYISGYTVQVHLSHIFEKVGVRSRRELLKRLFFDNVLPGLPR